MDKPSKPRNHTGPDFTLGGFNPYSSWKQIAAYFDGDGSVSIRVRPFTLTFSLEFSESYLPQLVQIKEFFSAQGIATPPIGVQRRRSGRVTNYVLKVHARQEVLRVCKRMVPYSYKKEWDLQTAIAYLEDRITAEEALRRLNISIESGRREGLLRTVSMPFTRREGIDVSARIAGKRSSGKRVKLNKEQIELLRRRRSETGASYGQLAREFEVSSDVVRTILGKK